jgi:hypothetical protein
MSCVRAMAGMASVRCLAGAMGVLIMVQWRGQHLPP